MGYKIQLTVRTFGPTREPLGGVQCDVYEEDGQIGGAATYASGALLGQLDLNLNRSMLAEDEPPSDQWVAFSKANHHPAAVFLREAGAPYFAGQDTVRTFPREAEIILIETTL